MTILEHIRYLSETIGPRGSTTRKEKEAAHYAQTVLENLGLRPQMQSFRSARSAWYPFALFSFLILVAEAIFWIDKSLGPKIAFGVALFALGSIVLELSFRKNPFRWVLPTGDSQNVIAKIQPTGEVRQRVILLGHLDTHRTPFIFSTDARTRVFQKLVTLGFGSSVILLILFGWGIFGGGITLRLVSIPFALVLAAIFLITLQADRTPYSPGANDNASGAATVMNLAEELVDHPLEHIEVWAALTGCEEVQCYGAEALARTFRKELSDCIWIVLDGIASKKGVPVYLEAETFLFPSKSDPDLLKLASAVAAEHPEWRMGKKTFSGAYTEGAIGSKYGFRTLTFMSFPPDGSLAEWHRPTDTVENLDVNVAQRVRDFVLKLLKKLDSKQEIGL
jgi:hypothetical protein